MLQQYLPLAVLKLDGLCRSLHLLPVATVLTACGIETNYSIFRPEKIILFVATVLTACGIETSFVDHKEL